MTPSKNVFPVKKEEESFQPIEMVTFVLNRHMHTHSRSERRTGEEHKTDDGVSPWEWTVGCHGDCVGHVLGGSLVTMGKIKGAKQRKQQEEASSQN